MSQYVKRIDFIITIFNVVNIVVIVNHKTIDVIWWKNNNISIIFFNNIIQILQKQYVFYYI